MMEWYDDDDDDDNENENKCFLRDQIESHKERDKIYWDNCLYIYLKEYNTLP